MTKVILTCAVEDPAKWEAGFRSHADLFRSISISKPIHFSVTDNDVTICIEPDDLQTYMASFDMPEIGVAMANDGVIRESVKVFVLDKSLEV